MKIPSVVTTLGRCLEIEIEQNDAIVTFAFPRTKKNRFLLTANEKGTALFIFQDEPKNVSDNMAKKSQSQISKAAKLFEDWSEYEASFLSGHSISEKKLKKYGTIKRIKYASEKWTKRTEWYVHEFKSKPNVFLNDLDEPNFIVVRGGRLKVKPEGIVG